MKRKMIIIIILFTLVSYYVMAKTNSFDSDFGIGVTWFNTEQFYLPYLHFYFDIQFHLFNIIQFGVELNPNISLYLAGYFVIPDLDLSVYSLCSINHPAIIHISESEN